MTKQYIDRNALLRQAETLFDGQREVMGVKAEHIYSAPVADVAPVVHGQWLNCKNGNGTCSECNFRQMGIYDDDNEQSYCGCCGAKMDGEKNEMS